MSTVIIGTLVLGAFASIGFYTHKEYKKGNACSGGCIGCPYSGKCRR